MMTPSLTSPANLSLALFQRLRERTLYPFDQYCDTGPKGRPLGQKY